LFFTFLFLYYRRQKNDQRLIGIKKAYQQLVSFLGYHYAFRLHNAIPAYPWGKFNMTLMELSVHFFVISAAKI